MSGVARHSLGIGGHQRGYEGRSDEWLTPPEIIRALGPFDLDPCAPSVRPWNTATLHYAHTEDGLTKPWNGRVWLNPPYGQQTFKWLAKLAAHGDGIALIFARTETRDFREFVWRRAHGLLFVDGRIHFHLPDGRRAAANSGAPSVLVAYGSANVEALSCSGIRGTLVKTWALVP